MSFSYSGDPTKSGKDEVRFYIGDTDKNDILFQDAEINALITLEGNNRSAAAKGAETLAAKFARQVDTKVGAVSEACSQAFKHYTDLAKKLRHDAAINLPIPYAGGLSISDKDARQSNSDRIEPSFTRRVHERRQGRVDSENNECDSRDQNVPGV